MKITCVFENNTAPIECSVVKDYEILGNTIKDVEYCGVSRAVYKNRFCDHYTPINLIDFPLTQKVKSTTYSFDDFVVDTSTSFVYSSLGYDWSALSAASSEENSQNRLVRSGTLPDTVEIDSATVTLNDGSTLRTSRGLRAFNASIDAVRNVEITNNGRSCYITTDQDHVSGSDQYIDYTGFANVRSSRSSQLMMSPENQERHLRSMTRRNPMELNILQTQN